MTGKWIAVVAHLVVTGSSHEDAVQQAHEALQKTENAAIRHRTVRVFQGTVAE